MWFGEVWFIFTTGFETFLYRGLEWLMLALIDYLCLYAKPSSGATPFQLSFWCLLVALPSLLSPLRGGKGFWFPDWKRLGCCVKNFYVFVDRDGKMPFLSASRRRVLSHPFFVQYVNDRPVAFCGPERVLASDVSGSKVWDFSRNVFVPICDLRRLVS